ncbi:MAG: hypothetical protein QF573_04445 [Chloroflexota bacterium]|nr:hypothetical protein [Chloroflexota bacterium]MDP6508278.1 hypothetical protein [Chloroflexota bacterium]
MPTIRIDDDVYAHLQEHATPLTDTPNSVLRRLLGLESAGAGEGEPVEAGGRRRKGRPAGTGRGGPRAGGRSRGRSRGVDEGPGEGRGGRRAR